MREGNSRLTLVVMGDPSLSPEGNPEVDEAIDDINCLHPDVVMVLGDLGNVRQGFDYASKTLRAFKGVVLPAIGNHDLQVKSCETDEENIKLFVEAFGLRNHYYSCEYGGILFITLSSERHRAHRWQPDEVFLSDRQLDWFQHTLEANPKTPTIVQCHAPIFGTQIPVIPEVHVHATNPYTNHNHHPERILKLIGQYPQIILWFSGHSHLGQDYPNSICYHSGVYFVHVGVHGSRSTRDGSRHSRVLEIEPDRILIRTFDHSLRTIDPRCDYKLDEGPYGLMCSWEVSRRSGFLSGRLKGFHVGQDGLYLKPLPTSNYLTYLDKPAAPSSQAICPMAEKIYVATRGGYVWEYDRVSGLPLGAIYADRHPTCVVGTDSHVWVGGGDGYIRKIPVDQPERFLRKRATNVHDGEIPIKGVVRTMQCIDQDCLFIGVDRRLYELNSQTNELIPKAVFKTNVLAIQFHRERLYVFTESNEIGVFSLPHVQPLQTLQIPSQLRELGFCDFIHVTNRLCFLASRKRNSLIKVTLKDMKVVDQFRIPGKIQTILFDEPETWVLTESGRLACIDMKDMTVKAQRDIKMKAASAIGMDDQFVYVATANPDSRWQEVQIIERRTDMIGELAYSVRTVDKIYPQLDIDMEVRTSHLFHPNLRAKVNGQWMDLKDKILPSQEFDIRIILGRRRAANPPYISGIKLRNKI